MPYQGHPNLHIDLGVRLGIRSILLFFYVSSLLVRTLRLQKPFPRGSRRTKKYMRLP